MAELLTRRSAIKAASLAAAAIGVGAVNRNAGAAASELVVALHGLPESLELGISSFANANLAMQVLDALVLRNDAGTLVPGLATAWTALDSASWRFDLRRGVRFHDGSEFTSADVKFTLDYVLAANSTYGLKSRINLITAVETPDAHSVILRTKGPFPTLIAGLVDIAIEPRGYVERVGRAGMTAHPVGTGPFQFRRWVSGDTYTLDAFDGYWGGAPGVRSLVLRNIPEASTRAAALMAGEVHIAEEISIDLIPPVRQSKNAEIASVESSVGLLITFDTTKPPFNDVRVRQALNYAVNKQEILDQLLLGQGSVLKGQMLTSNTFGADPSLQPFAYDPEKARALLKAAGVPAGFASSITTRSGKYLSDVDIANVCAAAFSEIGVKTTVNVVEEGVFTKMIRAHDMGPMHMVGWYSLGDADFATVWFTQASGRAFWKNDEFEKLFVQARSTVDEAARAQAYHRMMAIMHEEAPAIYLFGLPSIYGRSRSLRNWSPPSDKVLRLAKATIA